MGTLAIYSGLGEHNLDTWFPTFLPLPSGIVNLNGFGNLSHGDQRAEHEVAFPEESVVRELPYSRLKPLANRKSCRHDLQDYLESQAP